MVKEKIESDVDKPRDESLESPGSSAVRDFDAINVDSPPGIRDEIIDENFEVLVEIYKLLQSPNLEDQARIKIEYATLHDQDTATVWIDGKKYYFTDSQKEIDNFHSWEETRKRVRNEKNKRLN